MKRAIGALTISVLLMPSLGCAGALAAQSSGQIGCPANAITITDDKMRAWNRTWTAECAGVRYYCTGDQQSTSCKEFGGDDGGGEDEGESAAETAAPVESRGCQYDQECKGERICEGGACVAPS